MKVFIKTPKGGLEEPNHLSDSIDGRGIGIRPLRLSARDYIGNGIAFNQRKRGIFFQRAIWLPLSAVSGTGSRSDVIANPAFSSAAI
jgi:hypothetical protein